ncbi:C1 family peptidase [Planctomycetota bacterium]
MKKRTIFSLIIASFTPFIFTVELKAQLSRVDVDELKKRAERENWTFTVGENPATKYSLKQLCGLAEPNDWQSKKPFFVESVSKTEVLLESFDWREVAGCPPIRNQGGCGSCWAFSTVGALECAIMIEADSEQNLSEQWLVSCNQSGWDCDGGWFAHDYHLNEGALTDTCGDSGAVLEESFPYTATDADCECPYPHYYFIDSWSYIASSSEVPDVNDIKQAIMTYGPVSVSFYANSAFQAYTGGVFNGCEDELVNHAVVLVGWDDEPNDAGPDCPGVWIMRNSWGPGWGEDGYVRIEYGCSRIGYAACYIEYNPPEFEVTPPDGLNAFGLEGGSFEPCSISYMLTNNSGTDSVAWTAEHSEPWLNIEPNSGSLEPGEFTTAQVSIVSEADSLPLGTYADTVIFSGGLTYERTVTLNVVQTPEDFVEDFEEGLGIFVIDNNFGAGSGLWHISSVCQSAQPQGHSEPNALYYGVSSKCNYHAGNTEGVVTSKPISLVTAKPPVTLKFNYFLDTEGNPAIADIAEVEISKNNGPFVVVASNSDGSLSDPSGNWLHKQIDISDMADSIIRLRFSFKTIDNFFNKNPGFYIDDVAVYGAYTGDFEPDGDVDFYDYAVFASAWLSGQGDEQFSFFYDISEPPDDFIDVKDLDVFTENWLKGKVSE